MYAATTHPADFTQKALELQFARARHAQLLAAREGRIEDAARLQERAGSVRTQMERQTTPPPRPRRNGWLRAAGVGLVVAGLVGLGAAGAAHADETATPVRVAAAVSETVVEHQRVTGSLRAVSRSAVAAEESGAVAAVFIDEGQTVAAGQVVARLDDARHAANLAERRADVLTQESVVVEREAELFQARSDLEQLEGFAQRGVTTAREVRDGQTAVRVAEARLESARLRVESAQRLADLAQIRVDDLDVVAPFDGRVVARHVEPGEWVNPGDAVVTLVSAGTIEARLEVPERFAPALADAGAALTLRLETSAGAFTTADVRPVPEVDGRARTFPVVAEFDNAGDRLSPGMSVTAWVPAGVARPQLTVPKDAVIRSARGAHLFVVEAGDDEPRAVRRDVRVLFETGDRVALMAEADGVTPGDLVVVEGNERLGDDTIVSVLNPETVETRLALKH
ncbi:MAG: efflux RND transporter periplasmic adaptor subunit [Planctomycetota bacterium]